VFRAASWPGGDLPRRREAIKGVRVMEQKERETSLRELVGALMATCAGESNELTALSICIDAESSEDAQAMLEDVIGNMRRIVAANLAPPPPGATSH
jgi:LPS O-antigen subunit length determinant protein (WzzB/FepE family)